MSELSYTKLSDGEVSSRLSDLKDWAVENGQIAKSFSFDAYQKGLVFASAVGFLADALDHHPDILIGYQKVRVAVNTHSVNGLSPYDFELARRIDALS